MPELLTVFVQSRPPTLLADSTGGTGLTAKEAECFTLLVRVARGLELSFAGLVRLHGATRCLLN